MNLQQAKREASKRWHVHGGWAESEWVSETGVFYPHAVGVRVPDGRFTRLRLLGHGETFEAAFRMAERAISRDLERIEAARYSKPRERKSGELEQIELDGL